MLEIFNLDYDIWSKTLLWDDGTEIRRKQLILSAIGSWVIKARLIEGEEEKKLAKQ